MGRGDRPSGAAPLTLPLRTRPLQNHCGRRAIPQSRSEQRQFERCTTSASVCSMIHSTV